METPKILIIEDTQAHFNIIQEAVNRAIRGMQPLPEVRPVGTKEEIETVLAECLGRANILIIFDLEIINHGKKAWMGSYVKQLWNTPPDQVRIIVYSARSQGLEQLPERPHSRIVNKNSPGPGDPFGPLREAIEDAVRSLA